MNKLLIFLSVTFCLNVWSASLSEDKQFQSLMSFLSY